MNPIQLSQQLQQTLIQYLTTTFDVNRDQQEPALADFIRRSFARPRDLFAGPYLELTAPYRTSDSLEGLVSDGVLTPRLLDLPCVQRGQPLPPDAPLYTHQAAALRKLSAAHRNIVVSSGTGSGKTECFLFPILNDLLVDSTPGVRAVLIYPLNALVNDQLDRLRLLLRGTDITFGRYTSELNASADKARAAMQAEWRTMEPSRKRLFPQYPLPNEIIGRDQIREQGQVPQILITNYAMLEYLLLRPQDHPLFTSGTWRFVVLDEAHTYSGAQGIEVGLLLRRLKHRLGHAPGETRCIATSATLTSDDAADAARFAEALFGEPFAPDDVIFGDPDHAYILPAPPHQVPVDAYLHPRFEELLGKVRVDTWQDTEELALLMHEMGLVEEADLEVAERVSPARFLWEVLRGNTDLARLRQHMVEQGAPLEVLSVAEQLFGGRVPVGREQEALYHLIELAAMARPAVEEPSLLPARYHLFVRPPQGVWACLNPLCLEKRAGNHWSKLFATPRDSCDACHLPVYPLTVCRTCGQVYLRLQQVGKQYLPSAALSDEPETHYVTWRLIQENRGLADEDEESLVEQAGESVMGQSDFTLCLQCGYKVNAAQRCGCNTPSARTVLLHRVIKMRAGTVNQKKGEREEGVSHMNECARCHSRALKGTEIATDITVSGLTPLTLLTEDLYRSLPGSRQAELAAKPGGGRKLLSFYDSRQGAARFAAFVQDIVNQEAYRRLFREAVTTLATPAYWPDLEKVSDEGVTLALYHRVAHNDPTLRDGNGDLALHVRDASVLSTSQHRRILNHVRKQWFAEVTTQLRSRQSLEALGLLAVDYFEPTRPPALAGLARQLGLSPLETRTLVEYLLDDLRRAKVVVLPEGVNRDDPIFGRNRFSPRLVRAGAGKQEVAWVGKTVRHRRRQLITKLWRAKGLSADEATVLQVLDAIFDWLVDESDLLDTSRPVDGFQLRHDRLFFSVGASWSRCTRCQRLSSRGTALPCPHPYCDGQMEAITINPLDHTNFYYDTLQKPLVPLRIEEHTAQLDPERGREYQNRFKSGDINMLSCSTTFEMGIDLGELQAVVMSNIPPSVANYKQRAGRAGRRVSGTAFILAWASDRPHDQSYFKTPADIIGGTVRVPAIAVQNGVITQRHVNAMVLSEFLRYCAGRSTPPAFNGEVGAFFDEQTPGGAYYALLPEWLATHREVLSDLLRDFGVGVQSVAVAPKALEAFAQDLRAKGFEHYQTDAGYYKSERLNLGQQMLDRMSAGAMQNDLKPLHDEIDTLNQQLDRLKREDILNYLSDRGVLPSYSFPLHTVELRIPPHLLPARHLRLQRNLREAIREYAPGQEVVADKRIWKSAGLALMGKEPQVFAYHICPACNYLRLEDTPGKPLDALNDPCPVCHEAPPRGGWPMKRYLQPDGFRVASDSGQAAGQYVDRPFTLMRSALVPSAVATQPLGDVLSVGYDRNGKLLYVNEGADGKGFKICLKCGKNVGKTATRCTGKLNGVPCDGVLDSQKLYTLGFTPSTDTLHLNFAATPDIALPGPEAEGFWVSLKYALLQGASRALQIERRDIDGVLFPESATTGWRQTIVLYDNVPGGAGYVKRIQDEIPAVVAAALDILDCNCESSCYRCLREYGNQWEHELLNRHPITEFLRALDADLQSHVAGGALDVQPVAAVDPTVWLWQQVERATSALLLATNVLSLEPPTADGRTWLDLVQHLRQRQVTVRLYVQELPAPTPGDADALLLTTQLRLLLSKGVEMYQSNRQFPWVMVMDPDQPTACAVRVLQEAPLALERTTLLSQASLAWDTMQTYGRRVDATRLAFPEKTNVLDTATISGGTHERDFFAEVYAKPVVRLVVSDRYLDTREKLVDRLGAHIALAHQYKTLTQVHVTTRKSDEAQSKAIKDLEARFPDIDIKVQRPPNVPHDRSIILTRIDGTKARILIGVGLDFITPNGQVRDTFITIQDPFEP